jgi:hypothetical protein
MSNPNDSAPPPKDVLQFDEAEFTEPAHAVTTCSACKTPIADLYYEAGGKIVCDPCRQNIEAIFHGGSRLGRAFKAMVLGAIAAAAGAVLYYAIYKITGRNFGLVAIVVGLMVGGAVKSGSASRGGWFYQLIALFLTYSAIAAMLIPVALEQLQQQHQKQNEQVQEIIKKANEEAKAELKKKRDKPEIVASKSTDAGQVVEKLEQAKAKPADKAQGPNAVPNPPAAAGPKISKTINPTTEPAATKKAPDPVGQAGNPDADPDDDEEPGIVDDNLNAGGNPAFLFLVIVAGILFACSLPVLLAIQSPISGLIFAFALWEAWKMNRKVRLVINGPFHLAADQPVDLAVEDLDDER